MHNSTNSLSSTEWNAISAGLVDFHSIFYRFWTVCRPSFTDRVPTAAVAFDKEGDCIEFLINKEFWDSKTLTQKLFIICHECRHLILNHGKRGVRIMLKGKDHAVRANTAMDLCINEELVSRFGFVRSEIDPDNRFVWMDKVEEAVGESLPSNRCFEFYYNKLGKASDDAFKPSPGGGPPQVGETLDDHSGFTESETGDVSDEVMKRMDEELDDAEREALDTMMNDERNSMHRDVPASETGKGMMAGDSPLGHKYKLKREPVKVKRKWESIIKKWASKHMALVETTVDQWARLARRYNILPRGLSLPSEFEDDAFVRENKKVDVWFFLDTSGSCIQLANRFFRAARSLPKHRFNVKLFCFDTKVYETDLKSRIVKGGGGTRFDIIETYINKHATKYPDAVFVITDGAGNQVNPKKPQVWHWFLSYDYTNYIPTKSKHYKLKDYE